MLGDRSKKAQVIFLIGIFITGLLAFLMVIKFRPLESLEGMMYDLRFRLMGNTPPPENIVIAAIDDKSIERLGRWPWSRDKIARLITKLTEAGAELIVFDVFMTEKEEHDPVFVKTVRDAGNVLLPLVFYFDRRTDTKESEPLLNAAFHSIKDAEKFNRYAPLSVKGVLAPLPELIRESMSLGHINMVPDRDGILRWEMMALEYHGYLYPSLDAQTAAVYLAIPHEKVSVHATEGIQLGSKRYIPTDEYGRSLIFYYGPSGTFRQFSIADIMEDKIPSGFLQGKIVLIGATALGIYDLRVTPFSEVMAGVEKHANVIASVIENRFLRKAPFYVNLIILLLSGFILSITVGRFKSGISFIISFIMTLFLITLSYWLFAGKGIWINVGYPVITVLLVFVNGTAYSYAAEETYARKIRTMFSSYVTERVVDELIKNPGMAKLGGERTEVTILFSDVRGFTAFSENHSPEEVVTILNEYLGAMTEIIFKWEGTLDKFIGDAILAFWGAPMKQDNHADLAVKCALNMVKKLDELQQKWISEGKPALNAGIGINTGEVIVGNIGVEGKKMDYTIIGDHVNLASRVESLTKKYNAALLLTEFTLNKIKGAIVGGRISHVEATGLERVIVKGKEKAVAIYEAKSLEHGGQSRIVECEEGKIVRHKEK